MIKLGEILDVKRGASLSGNFYSSSGRYIRLTLGNFNYPNCGFKENISKNNLYFTGVVKPEYILKKGDIITPLTEQVSGLLGETAFIPEDDKYIQSGDIGLVLPLVDKADFKFCYYLLSSYLIKKQLGQGAQQTKIRHTSPEKIKDCVAPIPDLETQKMIGNTLYEIDSQIQRNNEMVQKLQVLGKVYFDKFSHSIHETRNVKEITDIIWGQCPNGNNILTYKTEDSISYASGAGDIDDDKITVNPKAYTNDSKRIIYEKTICMSVAGTVGKLCISDRRISIGRAMIGFYNEFEYGLIYFSLIKYLPIMQKQATGAIQKIINNEHLDVINIPILYKQQIEFLNKIVDICMNIENNTRNLILLKEKLLPLLINGQLQ